MASASSSFDQPLSHVQQYLLPPNFQCDVTKGHIDEVMSLVKDEKRFPKRIRDREYRYRRNESRKMDRAFYESTLAERSVNQFRDFTFILPPGFGDGSKFSIGQAVHHWWAHWFKSADSPPMQLKGKMRPSWYDAQIIAALGVNHVKYAGQDFEEPCYQVH